MKREVISIPYTDATASANSTKLHLIQTYTGDVTYAGKAVI